MREKPKKLFRYENHELEIHEITDECIPVLLNETLFDGWWRCRTRTHDFYGWDTMKGAVRAEIQETRYRLIEDQKWLEKLENRKSKWKVQGEAQ